MTLITELYLSDSKEYFINKFNNIEEVDIDAGGTFKEIKEYLEKFKIEFRPIKAFIGIGKEEKNLIDYPIIDLNDMSGSYCNVYILLRNMLLAAYRYDVTEKGIFLTKTSSIHAKNLGSYVEELPVNFIQDNKVASSIRIRRSK